MKLVFAIISLIISVQVALADAPLIWGSGDNAEFLTNGWYLSGGKQYINVSVDPSAGAGLAAPVGSVAVRNNAGTGVMYLKTGTADTAWTDMLSAITGVPAGRTINTTTPLQGGGNLSADRTFSITKADTSTDGYLSSVDWNTFNGKENAFTKRDFSVGTGLSITAGTGTGAVIQDLTVGIASGYYLPTTSDQSNWNAKQDAGDYITDLTGEVTASGPGSVAATIANSAVTNAKMANMADQTIKGNDSGGAAAPQDLTPAEVTAMLDVAVGDSGSGGTKGLVPAPGPGDATNCLLGDMTYGACGGGGGTWGSITGTLSDQNDLKNALDAKAPSTTGTSILKGDGSGGFASATSGTDYAPATSGTSILKGNGSGGFSSASAGTDYEAPLPSKAGNSGKVLGTNGTTNSYVGPDGIAFTPDDSDNWLVLPTQLQEALDNLAAQRPVINVSNNKWARITYSGGTPSVAAQSSPAWISSVTDGGTGATVLNFVSGTFSSTVNCVAQQQGNAGGAREIYSVDLPTTSSAKFVTTNEGGDADAPFMVTCSETAPPFTADIFEAGDYGWTSYTPSSTQGLGDLSGTTFQHKRVGDSLFLRMKFTTGTVSGSEARIALPDGLTLSASKVPGLQLFSVGKRNVTADAQVYCMHGTGGNSYVTFGKDGGGGSDNCLSAMLGNAAFASSNGYDFVSGPIPVSDANGDWSTFPIGVAAGNVRSDTTGQERIERATVNCDSSSSVVSQSGNWISGVGNVSSGACAITFATAWPNTNYACTVSGNPGNTHYSIAVISKATSGFTIEGKYNNGSSLSAYDADLICMGPR